MGITGLIPFLEKATRPVSLQDLRGSTLGIDTYCWLHRGAISCADKLIRGDLCDLHIKYCLKLVNLLLANRIRPVLVFDGRRLPAKEMTEKRRGVSRADAKEKAKELLREGKVNEARTYINRAVNITHDMAHQLIVECRKMNVDCIVAPFEADAELGFLSRKKLIDFVVTEDSDLTLFGCQKVIFKLDLNGQGLLFDAKHLHKVMGCREERYDLPTLNLKFQMMCILSGCDYLDSLKGIGLVKACKFVMMTEETDLKRCLSKIPQYLNMRALTVEDDYKDGFLRALATFRHMIVYDPKERRQCRLTEVGDDYLQYCGNAGEKLDEATAFQMAIGNVNPFSLKKMDSWDPSEMDTEQFVSIWDEPGRIKPSTAMKKTTSNAVITVNKKLTISSPVKRKFNRSIIEEEDSDKNTSIDIMNLYLGELGEMDAIEKAKTASQPETKKIRLSTDRDAKNPFLKKKVEIEVIERESPQKKISLLEQANSIKTVTNLSKFKKTLNVTDKKVSVVSRFFSPATVENGNMIDEMNPEDIKINGTEKYPEDASNEEVMENTLVPQDASPENVVSEIIEELITQVIVAEKLDENGNLKNAADSESDVESQDLECSALEFVEAEYSETDNVDTDEIQKTNEKSPVPWLKVKDEFKMLDPFSNSQVANKENGTDLNIIENEVPLVIIDDDDTPVKSGPQLLQQKTTKAPIAQKKRAQGLGAKKQTTLMSFFNKK